MCETQAMAKAKAKAKVLAGCSKAEGFTKGVLSSIFESLLTFTPPSLSLVSVGVAPLEALRRTSQPDNKLILLKCRLHLHQTCFSCGGKNKGGKEKKKRKKSFRPSDFRLQRPSKRLTFCLFLSAQRKSLESEQSRCRPPDVCII